MNCPSRTDPEVPDKYNQSPNALAGDSTTRSDLGRIASARLQRDHRLKTDEGPDVELQALERPADGGRGGGGCRRRLADSGEGDGARGEETGGGMLQSTLGTLHAMPGGASDDDGPHNGDLPIWRRSLRRTATVLKRYSKFIGPGFLISVAYIDPGNYSTDISAGASYRFRLLFIVLLSNLFAIFLQSLCIKLGTVTGLNLAQMCRAHFPRWLNYVLYGFAEAAIIATDIAEVIGTAIALELLSSGHIPLVAGCAISIVDVLFILLFYHPSSSGGSMRALRSFEIFVALLVLGVVVCFCFQLSLIEGVSVREVFRGYAPSSALVQGKGLYQACGILGATVMPHSLYLGSGIVQARLRDFDEGKGKGGTHTGEVAGAGDAASCGGNVEEAAEEEGGLVEEEEEDDDDDAMTASKYTPSLHAIKSCLHYSIAELAISLFTFALFVNSAILIVAGASLSTTAGASTATLFQIYALLSSSLAPAAATVFALALLLSGISAGIICTLAGQMVSEGALSTTFLKPWQRRLLTRSISITPSIIVAGALGKQGVSRALNGSQFALSVILPVVSAPVIWFTGRGRYMTVGGGAAGGRGGVGGRRGGAGVGVEMADVRRHDGVRCEQGTTGVDMANSWFTTGLAVCIWLVIVMMNVASLVLVGLGDS